MPPLIRGLLRPQAYDHAVAAFQVLETHISWVILTGEYAYKLKKPVNLGFVDFTTLDRRRYFCDEEIRLNRRLSPELYLGVRPIFGSTDQPTFLGSGEPIEFAVQMRQFDQKQLLPAVLQRGELRSDHIDRLSVAVANFHNQSASAGDHSPFGTPDAVCVPVWENFESLESTAVFGEQIASLKAWSEAEFQQRREWFQERKAGGKIRECHGDMHLGNMMLLHDEIRLFDCLEFNPTLRWIDVISEIAFLVMDLQERRRPDLAFRFLNRWLEQTGDYEGLTGWRWYLAYRALVRAKVAALRLQQPEIDDAERTIKQQELTTYIELASRSIQPRQTGLIVMHGLSGSGKSHVAQWICERYGAIRLRTDAERKRLFGKWGVPSKNPMTGDMYAPEVTQRVYREIVAGHVPGILAAGFPVVVDAACLKRWQRGCFQELAVGLGVGCLILDVQANRETMRSRLRQRQSAGEDPSDADYVVLDRQLADVEPLTSAERRSTFTVDTESADWEASLDAELHHVFKC
jgi:uncharacterized protein